MAISARKARAGRQKPVAMVFLALLVTVAGSIESAVIAQKRRPTSDSEAWRRVPPKPGSPRPLKLPLTREVQLKNGLKLVFVEDHRTPMVTVLVGIPLQLQPFKDIDALNNQTALAEAAADLLTEGAGSRTSEQLAREVETLGGRISSTANDDYAEVIGSVVAENVERLMGMLADVVIRPSFPENEVALHKRNRIQNLVVQRQDPAYLASEQFDRVVFGSHPYAISSPSPASIESLDRPKIEQFYRSHFEPRGSVVVIAGDFNVDRIIETARALFNQWKETTGRESTSTLASDQFPHPEVRRVYLIDRPGSEQADIRIGGLGITRGHPDYFPLLVTNAILGAGTNSRLFLNIRERKGFAYDVYSSVDAMRYGGTVVGGAQTRSEVVGAAIKEVLSEFDRLGRMRVTASELQGAKNYLNGLFSLALSTEGGVTERIAQKHLLELGSNYLESYRTRIESVTPEQVQQAARKYLSIERPAIVVVGDSLKLKNQLESIGRVEVLSIEGKPAKSVQQ
ncbi:MAG TPA: pitrilysin family protein [Blastocatellia bacterium]|nr:pitrilysin family protein [Blastocatellia bacterium]